MKSKGTRELGIYIHIPFCVKKCAYCDFLSFQSDSMMRKEYLKALKREIKSCKELEEDYKVRTIFFGGGTPSILSGDEIASILDELGEIFDWNRYDKSVETTMECNPGTLTEENLTGYKKAGINRLSIGLQSVSEDELKVLGRIHTYEEFLANYKMAREVGFTNINIDVMSALPGQDETSWRDTLTKVLALRPEHISAYSLIIEEGTKFYEWYQNGEDLPGEEVDRVIYHLTKEILESCGYHRYEVSNYCLPGYECLHNSSYWQGIEYLGLGLGSASLMNHTRYHNVEDLTEYLSWSHDRSKLRRDEILLTKENEMEEFMFLGLRMDHGVSRTKFHKQFGVEMDQIYKEVLDSLYKKKLIDWDEDRVWLLEQGVDVSNYVLARFLLD